MAKINGLCVGESLVGEGNEVAHIDLIMGPRGSTAETAFAKCLTNNKDLVLDAGASTHWRGERELRRITNRA